MSTPLYLKDPSGNELYLTNNEGDEYYLTGRTQVFAIKEGKRYYAKDKDKNEIYPIVNNKAQTIPFLYAKNALGNDTYPTDAHGNEFPIPEQGTGGFMYATDKDGNAFYPTDNTGKEITYGKYIYKKDGFIQFPLNREGYPEYQTDDATNDEVYVIKMDGSVHWGVDQNGNQRYAKKENGDEYYPMNGEFARDQNGTPQYARTSDGEVIFPLDAKGNESYLKDNGESHVIHVDNVLLDRYIKTKNGEEMYPIQMMKPTHFKEVILNEKYAKTALQEAKYPLDEYGNEYTLKIPADIAGKEKDYFPLGYPITNDNFIIIPEVNGKKIISDQLFPNVQVTNITGILYREDKNYRDYVTNLKSTRLSRAADKGYMVVAINNVVQGGNAKPLKKHSAKISYSLRWSLIGIVILILLAIVYCLYKFLFQPIT
ncbi:uncharacterized protein TNCT_636201 [Trichonephila clavata]|uniref:WG repeat-containing protein n=2 Tax=Trichonephila clavata TaxID=2740835 RepID=A0A8X6F9A1_TRICU|nr:uncharacterized protein TNCT_248141 [Trichonephila clavata]GFR15907.1 uncharacterized protein TNCT_636201 [Trichonephila clavata]